MKPYSRSAISVTTAVVLMAVRGSATAQVGVCPWTWPISDSSEELTIVSLSLHHSGTPNAPDGSDIPTSENLQTVATFLASAFVGPRRDDVIIVIPAAPYSWDISRPSTSQELSDKLLKVGWQVTHVQTNDS